MPKVAGESTADDGKVRTEIYATGFRNPFKFDIDQTTGDLWIGDVGMDLWEEVSRIQKGDDAGWSFWEGNHERTNIAHRKVVANPKFPEVEYAHGSDGNSVTGGLLYRGTAYPATGLQGKYIFGDFGSGKIWTLVPGTSNKVALPTGGLSSIVDFEVDPNNGEILLLQHSTSGKLMRLRESPPVTDPFPQQLSLTGVFANLTTLTPNPGVVPYQPNLKFWSDGADKSRFFLLKNLTDQMGYSRDGVWTFPEGMVWVKHFDMDLNRDQPGTNIKRLETRFIVRNSGGIYGVSYKWNAAGTDATLVSAAGDDFDLSILSGGSSQTQRWHIPSRAECITCHNPAAGHILSPTTQQLNRVAQLGSTAGNMLTLLSDSGYLAGFTDNPATLPRTSLPTDTTVNIEERVRSYLTVNCTYCHRDGGGANQTWGTAGQDTIDQMGILYGVPQSETYHDANDRFIIPGNKTDSLIYNRIQARSLIGDGTHNGYSQMPPIATNVVDQDGVQLLAEWIDTFANVAPTIAAPATATVTENAPVGGVVAIVAANDPDMRAGQPDNNFLSYSITAGNPNNLFTINPTTGQISINGILDYEMSTQHALQITVADNFAANPKSAVHNLAVNLQNVANEDANGNGIPDWWESSFTANLAAAGDADGDGVRDFFEFLAGSDPEHPDTGASLNLRVAAYVPGPTPGYYVTWRARNGLFLGQHYFARTAATPGGTWTTLQPANYQVVSVTPIAPALSEVVLFVPASGASFFRLSDGP